MFRYHILAVHEKLFPYVCDKCGKAFAKKAKLNYHYRRVHEGYRPHQCPHCDKAFGHKDSYNAHVEAIHGGGVRKYLCDQCNKQVIKKCTC